MFNLINMQGKTYFLLTCLFFNFFQIYSQQSLEETFTKIYDNKSWGVDDEGNGTSGLGSLPETTFLYRTFLQEFLKKYEIRSVIDVGCGDWQFSKTLNWDGIQYFGYDVVKSVIQKNQKKYSQANVCFIHGNALTLDLPSVDLLICKDVLQHLPHKEIFKLIAQFGKFKYLLIVNDVDNETLSSRNKEMGCGGYRTLDLTKSPYNLSGKKVLTYSTGEVFKINEPGTTKQVLLIQN